MRQGTSTPSSTGTSWNSSGSTCSAVVRKGKRGTRRERIVERPDEGAFPQARGAGIGGAESVAERPGAGVDQRGSPRRREGKDPGGAGRAADPGGRRWAGDGPSAIREGGVPRPVRPVGTAAGVPETRPSRGGGVRPLPEIRRCG